MLLKWAAQALALCANSPSTPSSTSTSTAHKSGRRRVICGTRRSTHPAYPQPLYLLLLLLLPSLSADLCERGASVKLTNLSAREARDDAAPGSPTKNSAANHLATVPLTISAPSPSPSLCLPLCISGLKSKHSGNQVQNVQQIKHK